MNRTRSSTRSPGKDRGLRSHRNQWSQKRRRYAFFESLEARHLLSTTLSTIDQAVLAGAPLNIALNPSSSWGSDAVNYTVSVSNSTTANPQLTAVIPQGNPSLKITVSDPTDGISGSMVFQLDKDLVPEAISAITALVNANFYTTNTSTIYRVANEPDYDFIVVQGAPMQAPRRQNGMMSSTSTRSSPALASWPWPTAARTRTVPSSSSRAMPRDISTSGIPSWVS